MSFPKKTPKLTCGKSLTRKVAPDSWDINRIIKKFKVTGLLPAGRQGAVYADLTNVPDLVEAANVRDNARLHFEALPKKLRDELQGDYRNLEGWLKNKKNFDEAVEYGLLVKRPAPEPEKKQAPEPEKKDAKSEK